MSLDDPRIEALAAELQPDRGGLRPLNPAGVASLVSSMEGIGFAPDQRIIVDQFGRILDGRHRIAAAEQLGIEWSPKYVEKKHVDSDREALAYAYHLNAGMLSAEDKRWRARLAKRLTGESDIAKLLGDGPLIKTPVTPPVTPPELCPTCGQEVKRFCEWCGNPMPADKRPEARTCSTRCRVAAHREARRG